MYDAKELLQVLRPLMRAHRGKLRWYDKGLAILAKKLTAAATGAQLYELARSIVICSEAMRRTRGAEALAEPLKAQLLRPVVLSLTRAVRVEIAGRARLASVSQQERTAIIVRRPSANTGVRIGGLGHAH